MRSGRSWLVMMLASVVVAAVAGAEESPRNITVVGVGREIGAPDMASLSLAVEATAPTARAASQAAAKSAAQLIEALQKKLGEDGKVQTSGYNLHPVYRQEDGRASPDRPQRPEIIAYTASNEVRVESRRVDGVGALIDTAVTSGAARIGAVSFALHDPGPARNRALQAAGADASGQAAAIAAALQVRLARVLEASTEDGVRPISYKRSVMAMAAEAMTTPIEPGDVTTEVRLRVTYGIE
ncbi:MAG: SIMPL domain-containing protein [Myxococcales bacterium]|nr:SIMPL domain-containing protein [Myxococcales bacterium]